MSDTLVLMGNMVVLLRILCFQGCQSVGMALVQGVEFFYGFDEGGDEVGVGYGFVAVFIGVDELWVDFFYFLGDDTDLLRVVVSVFPVVADSAEGEDVFEGRWESLDFFFVAGVGFVEDTIGSYISVRIKENFC